MSAVRIVMVLAGGVFFVLGTLHPPGDGDLWWQRWLGELILRTHHIPSVLGPETFSAAGAPWVPQEWFLSIVVAAAMNSGTFELLKLATAAIPIGILLSIYSRTRERAAPLDIAVVLLFCIIALEGSFGVRAQVLGWGCFAAFLLFLDRRDAWYYGAIPAVALWANVHASAALGPVFLAARIIGAVADGGPGALRASRDLRILPFVALALFCTPLGWHLPAYVVMLVGSPIRHFIEEWQPVTLGETEFLFGALPLALLIALGGLRAILRNKMESLPIAMLFILVLLARRNVPLFAIAAAPMAAACLALRFPRLRNITVRVDGLERFAIVSTCVAFAVSGLAVVRIWRTAPPMVPTAAIARLADGGEPRRLFCENFSACSPALQYPNVRVYMDGRCDPYPLDVWNAYISTIALGPSWKSTLKRYAVDSIVASRGSKFAKALAANGSWHRAYSDSAFVLYVRT